MRGDIEIIYLMVSDFEDVKPHLIMFGIWGGATLEATTKNGGGGGRKNVGEAMGDK